MILNRLAAIALTLTCAMLPALAKAEKPTQVVIITVSAPAKPDGPVEIPREEVKAAVQEASVALNPKKHGRIWCVPFARAVSGIQIKGDAATWWKKAASLYERGQTPASGAVLTFRSTGKMPKGHVAVVSEVIDSRTILVDQANWVRNRITTDTIVVDVSPKNDWSAVRVANGTSEVLGRVSPTYGFIYPVRG